MNKSKILNIVIIILALALIIFLIAKGKSNNVEETPIEETPSETENTGGNVEAVIPMPSAESWEGKTIKNEISFDAPNNYYISYPVIGECRDVISISTQTPTDPTIAVAMIYKDGCVIDVDVTTGYTHREVKDGYVFQTNSNHPTVLAVFNQIVASAKAE